jgi:hypothetical protein
MPKAPSPRDLLSAGTKESIENARAKAKGEAEHVLETAREKIRKSQDLIARVDELLARR